MKVRPRSPLVTNLGLWVSPVRGRTAEWRTKRPNARARLRRTGFVSVGFNICSWPNLAWIRLQLSSAQQTGKTVSRLLQCLGERAAAILRHFADDCLTVMLRSVLILVGNFRTNS